MAEKVPARYEIETTPAFFKDLFYKKLDHYSFLALPEDGKMATDGERNPDNIANRLRDIEVGDSLVFRYDPTRLDNITYMGDAGGVYELERMIVDIKKNKGPLGRPLVALYFDNE